MNVFVTGASGFVGRTLLGQLHSAGHSVRVLARDTRSLTLLNSETGSAPAVHRGNILDAASLEGALAGMDAVIHLVGIIGEFGRNTFENVHTQGTANTLKAMNQARGIRFIHMSALGTRPGATSRYFQSKWAAEESVRRSGLDYTIFRPSIIYGSDDKFVNLFARMSRFSPVLPMIGSGRSKFQPVPVEDVAACFVKSLTEPRSIGRTYDLCSAERVTLEEILDVILEVTRRKRFKLPVPWGVARLQAALLEWIYPRLLGRPSPLNRDQLVMLQEDNLGDSKPAADLFGLGSTSFREGIARYLRR